MNSDNLMQLAQKGLRVTLGATASFLETLQDPQRREESFSRFRNEFSQLTEEWEVKGETTEREARHFVDELLSQRGHSYPTSSTPTSTTATTIASHTRHSARFARPDCPIGCYSSRIRATSRAGLIAEESFLEKECKKEGRLCQGVPISSVSEWVQCQGKPALKSLLTRNTRNLLVVFPILSA